MSAEAAVPLFCYLQAVNVSKVKCGIVLWASTVSAFAFGLMYHLGCQALLSGYADTVTSSLFFCRWSACCARVVAPLNASAVPFIPES